MTRRIGTIWLASLLLSLVFVIAPSDVSAAQGYSWCHPGNVKTALRCGPKDKQGPVANVADIGPFMCDVCKECIDDGTCSLTDIMIVTGNTGNFLLSIVGGLALLLFVIGGLYMLTSGGVATRRQKGIKFIWAAFIGVIITFSGILLLRTTIGVLKSGTLGRGTTADELQCANVENGFFCEIDGQFGECQNEICVLDEPIPEVVQYEAPPSGFGEEEGLSPEDQATLDALNELSDSDY